MDKGFIKLSREIADHPLWLASPFTPGQAWVDLLMLASWKASRFYIRGNRVDVKRGQLAYSIKKLAERWQWSRGKAKRFLDELENDHQIRQQNMAVTTLITIVNFDKYQSKRTPDETTDGHQTEHQTDIRRTSDGHQTDTLEEGKEVKEGKEQDQNNSAEQKNCSTPPVFTLTLNTGDEFPITQKHIDEWTKLYPAVDIIQSLRNMRGWLNANPKKRKTKAGILRFVNSWLSREQDRGGQNATHQPAHKLSLSERATQAREEYERSEQSDNGEFVGATHTLVRP